MQVRSFSIVLALLVFAGGAFAQTSWLDRPLNTNWNNGSGTVPTAPRVGGDPASTAQCTGEIRAPESIADRAVTRAGWTLFGASQTYGPVTVVKALASFDGMCRPLQYNVFVFVSIRFAGTLSPTVMNSRSDGSAAEVRLTNAETIVAEFNRYTSSDALCCPSQTSMVTYSVAGGVRPLVKASDVDTITTCQNQGGDEVDENVVTGTVTYRQRIALPASAVITVKLVDVSRADASSTLIAEQRIDTAGRQVPFTFSLPYKPTAIQERNRYAVQAQITDNDRLIYISDVSYPVITQGNLKTAEIVVVPVRGGGGGQGGGGNRDRTLRGTVTYLQRIALPANSVVTVRLVEVNNQNVVGETIAETTVNTNNRQVPISFELPYEQNRTNQQSTYALEAEISSEGKLAYKTAAPSPVQLRGNSGGGNIQLTVAPAATAITGKTISLSKFGTGSLKIGDRAAQFLIRGSVTVGTNGNAQITLSSLEGSVSFSGKLTYFDETTLRITVESSGDADASGEIEIKYNGRRLNSISASNLELDGQDVVLKL